MGWVFHRAEEERRGGSKNEVRWIKQRDAKDGEVNIVCTNKAN